MKRKLKNILMIVLIVLVGTSMYFTIDSAKNSLSSQTSTQENNSMSTPGGTPPDKPSGDNTSSSDNNMGTPPEKPDNDTTSSDNSNSENQNSSDNNQMGPGGNNNSEMTPPNMPENNQESNSSISVLYYVLFGVEGLVLSLILIYLLMSGFNKKTFKETMTSTDKKIIYLLSVIVLTATLTTTEALIANQKNINNDQKQTISTESITEASGATVVDKTEKTLNDTYESETIDESPILVKNGGTANIKNATINKKSGDSSNTENSEFKGINSGILVTEGTANISNSTIKTSAKGSNAVFATGEKSKIYINDSTITTTGSSSSRGLDATYGGYIKADNVKITTQGGSCATLATDRGEGTVIANNSSLETNGQGSPIIYSTGDISIDNTQGTANGSQMVVIEGKNSATITNSTLSASAKGNRNDVDKAGVMIYQSMSGDASEGKGTFTSKDSSLSIQSTSSYYKTAPMFFITNTTAEINLENTKLSYGSNILVSAKGTSEWGNTNSNGGNVTLNAKSQTLTGNIEVDKISTLTMNLTESTYKGTINTDNSAKSITLKLDKNSKITLTGDSYVTTLEDADTSYSNIDFNGYKLYVGGKAVN